MKTWENTLFSEIKNKEYFKNLLRFVAFEREKHVIYPGEEVVFRAFELTPINQVKVVIVGQDPYSNPNQATGLAFSLPVGTELTPSLRNIFEEISREFNVTMRPDGDLNYLAKQGVLLLNAILTVRVHEPLSHDNNEYRLLFEDILKTLNSLDQPIVFLLWGTRARKLKTHLTNKNHLVLEANHPSPLSANRGGWFGNNHFIQTNQFLKQHNLSPIEWKN